MEMMRRLRAVNVDHLHVGWYQSTYLGSFVNKTLLDSQFSYQSSIEESVVLIYGKYRIVLLHKNQLYMYTEWQQIDKNVIPLVRISL